MVIYGAVLPWNAFLSHAPEFVRPGESTTEVFVRILHEQIEDISTLRRRFDNETIVWAGDFNQSVTGPNRSGSHAKRDALRVAFERLGFEAWNGEAAHANEPLCAVDLICGQPTHRPTVQGRIDPIADGVVMSDHAGYWVDI